MRSKLLYGLLLLFFLGGGAVFASDTIYYEDWDISNLKNIGGHAVTPLGDPQIVSTELGDAILFDGDGDRLLVDFNPLKDTKEFTVELIFKPDACYPDNTAPRFLHIQDPDDTEGKRVMIELRIDANNLCYMDGFVKTDAGSLALIDESKVHPTEVWQHVAITYKDSMLSTYFNGEKELSDTLLYHDAIVNTIGKTSLGGRMNNVAFYAGLIKRLKVTHACLEPEEFSIPDIQDTSTTRSSKIYRPSDLETFPIPANQYFKLKMHPGSPEMKAELIITDSSGKMCFRQSDLTHKELLTIDTADFPDGIYLLSIKSQECAVNKRIVVLH